MSAQEYDMSWQAGDSQTHSFRYLDPNGDVIAIQSGLMQLRTRIQDPTVVVEKTAVVDSITGVVSFNFTPEETGTLVTVAKPRNTFVYDTQVVTDEGKTLTLTTGNIVVELTVTRPY